MYNLYGRGKYYKVNPKGEIGVNGRFSPTWRVAAVAPRWNTSYYNSVMWPEVKKLLNAGRTVTGYLYDIDHGTLRFWGGQYMGKIPKVKLWKD